LRSTDIRSLGFTNQRLLAVFEKTNEIKLFSVQQGEIPTQITANLKQEPLVFPMARSDTPPAHVFSVFDKCLFYISSELRVIVVDTEHLTVIEHAFEQKVMSASLNQSLLFVAALDRSSIKVSCNLLSQNGIVTLDKNPFVLTAQTAGCLNFNHALVEGDFYHLLLFLQGQDMQKPLTGDRLFLISNSSIKMVHDTQQLSKPGEQQDKVVHLKLLVVRGMSCSMLFYSNYRILIHAIVLDKLRLVSTVRLKKTCSSLV